MKEQIDPIILSPVEKAGIEAAKRDLDAALKDDATLLTRALLTENDTLKLLAKRTYGSLMYTRLVAIIAIGIAIITFSRDTEFRYFYIDSKGHVYETFGLKYPTITPETVINFAQEAATKFHTWTYKNYKRNFVELGQYCDPKTIGSYFGKLEKDGVFSAAERYVQHYDGVTTSAKLSGMKTIGTDGRLVWRVDLKVSEDITGSMKPVSNTYDVTLDIEQVPLSESFRAMKCVRIDENIRVGQ